jgi:hypothetical protein
MDTLKRTKGQTIQWTHKKGQKDKQYNGHTKKDKRTNNAMNTLKRIKGHCLSFCPF